mmetsp:Transcript_87929/g.138811  ORF Transcript_87929/g.138811 Transcript_87929/m.138811 type:complete len:216 (+) Transcript_87929:88-735(+)
MAMPRLLLVALVANISTSIATSSSSSSSSETSTTMSATTGMQQTQSWAFLNTPSTCDNPTNETDFYTITGVSGGHCVTSVRSNETVTQAAVYYKWTFACSSTADSVDLAVQQCTSESACISDSCSTFVTLRFTQTMLNKMVTGQCFEYCVAPCADASATRGAQSNATISVTDINCVSSTTASSTTAASGGGQVGGTQTTTPFALVGAALSIVALY